MKFFKKGTDGGDKSNVTGFWLVEIKSLFSIVLLCFEKGSRESYHSHAFNAITFFIKGEVREDHKASKSLHWKPSFLPKYTSRDCFHKVFAIKRTWAISIRGPWAKNWEEYNRETNTTTVFSSGRKVVSIKKGVNDENDKCG